MAIDPHKLRTLVFEKTGIKVDIDDPIFALVALNEAVLEESVERHLARLDAASEQLAGLVRSAGGAPPAAAPGTGSAYIAPPAPIGGRPIATSHEGFSRRELRLLGAAAAVAVLTAVLVLAGQALLAKPALSAEQQAALATAARLERALPRLDPRTRATLEAELAKP